ncbi:ATP-binding cassette domain-containing protein, partial [archaeon]
MYLFPCFVRVHARVRAGAGKTTTVSILTGLIAPTAGDAVVFGASVVNDIARIRDMTGVCPQHDILFDDLTVEEHLQLFGGLKGLRGVELMHRMNEMLTDLGLQEKRNARASTLSGGQKRRVSVAIAMMGDPRLLLLDEPTSGLDPAARRQVWGMIQKHKQGRVIILTTHFMDEADILGDRIALMARGRLRVAGSSLYLKKKFGAGYHLSVLLPALATAPSSSA